MSRKTGDSDTGKGRSKNDGIEGSMTGNMKSVIADKLLELAKKRGLDKVTVNQLTSACGISRQAFYYYYPDIPSVAQSVLRDALEDVLRLSGETGDPTAAYRVFAEEMVKHFPAISVCMNSKLRKELEFQMLSEMKRFIRGIVVENGVSWDVVLPKSRLDFCADFLACGTTAYLIEHCGDRAFDVDEFVSQMVPLLDGFFRRR